jgi:hypothetical protein
MKKEEAERQVVRRWLALPPAERATETQAAQFAMRMKDEYQFKCSPDRYQVIKGWLQNRLYVA